MILSKNKKYAVAAVALTSLTVAGIFLLRGRTGKKIINEALKYVGIQELRTKSSEGKIIQNKGWNNTLFQSYMEKLGWKSGYDYCVLFTKLVLVNSLKNKKRDIVMSLFNASSQTTWANLVKNQKSGLYKLSKNAEEGAIAFYKHMNANWRGHADVVIEHNKQNYKVVTANGSVGVEIKTREYLFNSNKMRLLGFVIFN